MNLSKISDENLQKEKDTIKKLYLFSEKFKSVVFNAGAGSGKTYSLVECLKYIIRNHRDNLKSHNQKIMCITYTNVAANHIKKQIGSSDIVEISTIHERIWDIIKGQKNVLLSLHSEKLKIEINTINNELLTNSDYNEYRLLRKEKKDEFLVLMHTYKKQYNAAYNLNASGFRDAMPKKLIANYAELIKNIAKFKKLVNSLLKKEKYSECLNKIKAGEKKYSTVKYISLYNRDRLEKMRISHDTLLEYGEQIVSKYPKMRQIIIDCYPYILIDEYQDTSKKVITIMNLLDEYGKKIKHNVFFAYFGDYLQNIYDIGIGKSLFDIHQNLSTVSKIYNRRSYKEIIDVANNIRNDGLVQKSIFSDCTGGSVKFYKGTKNDIKIFIEMLSKEWNASVQNPVHCLFATNKLVAEYSKFLLLYNAISQSDIYKGIGFKQINSEFLSHDITNLGIVATLLYKLMKLYCNIRINKSSLLDIFPIDEYNNMSLNSLKTTINLLRSINGESLDELLINIFTIYDGPKNITYQLIIKRLFDFDEEISYNTVIEYLATSLYTTSWNNDTDAKTLIQELLKVDIRQLLNWYHYINRDEEKDVCYHTFHSTKGLEYKNVIIILEKGFGIDRNLFENYFIDYNKSCVSNLKKYEEGRNIVYVAITRAIKNLRILYIDDIEKVEDSIKDIFGKVYVFPNDLTNID